MNNYKPFTVDMRNEVILHVTFVGSEILEVDISTIYIQHTYVGLLCLCYRSMDDRLQCWSTLVLMNACVR